MNINQPKKIKTVAIVQARMGSRRLPGKVLMDLAGKPMLARVIDRLRHCETLDQIAVATSENTSDNAIVEFCQQNKVAVFRGSEHDVLSRYVAAANQYDADNIVRITSDCPIIDPELVDRIVHKLADGDEYDYVCNFHPTRTYPRGLDCEVFRKSTLMKVCEHANTKRLREHVTLAIYENPGQYRIGSVSGFGNAADLRWTVDTAEDMELAREIFDYFGEQYFGWKDCVSAFERNPFWSRINEQIIQKAA